jgi:hypothetical protein
MEDTKDLLMWMERMYSISYSQNPLYWNILHPNNMYCNGNEGQYATLWVPNKDKFDFYKFTIKYGYRVDENLVSYPMEGIMHYILFIFECRDKYDKILKIPQPNQSIDLYTSSEEYYERGYFSPTIVNEYGNFKAVFSNIETAEKACYSYLRHIIYPYGYILSEEDQEEFNIFVTKFREEHNLD